MEDLASLIDKAKKGDKEAYGILYKKYYTKIYRYCRINLKSSLTADDTCQEVFIRAWKNMPRFSERDGGTFQAFLFRIARNLIIDLSRKKKEAPIEEAENVASDEDLAESLDRKNEIALVQKALSKLKEIDRQIIQLRYFEEMSHAEIAKILGIREGALRVRTIRLLSKMKDLIQK